MGTLFILTARVVMVIILTVTLLFGVVFVGGGISAAILSGTVTLYGVFAVPVCAVLLVIFTIGMLGLIREACVQSPYASSCSDTMQPGSDPC